MGSHGNRKIEVIGPTQRVPCCGGSPLPPLEGSRGSQATLGETDSVSAASSHRCRRTPSSWGTQFIGTSSRLSSSDTLIATDLHAFVGSSRRTSVPSQVRTERCLDAERGVVGQWMVESPVKSPQEDEVVKAMLPVLKRAMVSPNKAVVQASLDSMRQIQRMFGQGAIDRHMDSLGDVLEKQGSGPGGSARTALVLEALAGLCSQDAGDILKRRFPLQVPAPQVLATCA